MTLQIDVQTGTVTREGRIVGHVEEANSQPTLKLELQFSSFEEVVVALSWLAQGLDDLGPARPKSDLTIATSDDAISEEFPVVRFLTEKQVKRGGYVWEFHKSDVDPWPSMFHGHDYEKGLKIDVLSGAIYDVGTRQLCKRVNRSALREIITELRASKDFRDRVVEMIDEPEKQKSEAK